MISYTIAQLLPDCIRNLALEEGKHYMVSDASALEVGPKENRTIAYVLFVSDSQTGESIPVTWTLKDEERAAEDDAFKEEIIGNLAENAVDSLTHLIEFKETGKLA